MPGKTGSKSLYRGGTFDTDLGKGFKRTEGEIIKQDILNHIFTRKGERPMMPDFGTNLQDMLFDPNDSITQNRIASEVQAVIDQDPRAELIRLTVTPDEETHFITVELLVRFIELEVVDTISIDFPENGV